MKVNFQDPKLLAAIGFIGISSGILQILGAFSESSKLQHWSFYALFGCFLVYILISRQQRKTPLPELSQLFSIPSCDNYVSIVEKESELSQIVALADAHYTCPINRLEYKKAMWSKNRHCFFIVKDEQGVVKANINLLPLTEAAYQKLRDGEILESELTANDIHSLDQKLLVKYIYVEGLLAKSGDGIVCDRVSIIVIAKNFEAFVKHLATDFNGCVICAISGSKEGNNLMSRLGMYIEKGATDRKDSLHFLQADFTTVLKSLNNKTVLRILNKVIP